MKREMVMKYNKILIQIAYPDYISLFKLQIKSIGYLDL